MERSPICPGCLSKWPDIHGLLYAPGGHIGTQCDNPWHKGPGYNPSKLNLTEDDLLLLSYLKIGV